MKRNILRRVICRLRTGHAYMREHDATRWYLRCRHCLHTTKGWSVRKHVSVAVLLIAGCL